MSEITMTDAVVHENVVRLVYERVIQGFPFPCFVGRTAQGQPIVRVVPAFALVLEWVGNPHALVIITLLDLLMYVDWQHVAPDQADALMLSYFRLLLAAGQAVHDAGEYHLDIKPDNIWLGFQHAAGGAHVQLKLADFRCAQKLDVHVL